MNIVYNSFAGKLHTFPVSNILCDNGMTKAEQKTMLHIFISYKQTYAVFQVQFEQRAKSRK